MKTTTIGVFTKHTDAEEAVTALRDYNIADSDISYIYRDAEGDVKDKQTGDKVGEGAAKGAGTGAVIGAIAGLAVTNGILPGLGTLFVAGPLATALGMTGAAATTVAGAATGAVAGGIIGALTNLGVDKKDAEIYENQIKGGNIVLIVESDEAIPSGIATILTDNNATEVREYTRS